MLAAVPFLMTKNNLDGKKQTLRGDNNNDGNDEDVGNMLRFLISRYSPKSSLNKLKLFSQMKLGDICFFVKIFFNFFSSNYFEK